MASTCLDVIKLALKLAKVLPSGGTPTSSETTDGMSCLQSLYDEWLTGGMFGTLDDIYLTEDANAQEGKRYYVPAGKTLTAATNDYTPEFQTDDYGSDFGSTSGVTRQPRDMAVYESLTAAGTRTVKLYDRTEWVDLLDLQSSDEAPLSKRDAVGLAACLALSGGFKAMFGGEVGPEMVAKAQHFLRNVMGKAGSTQDRLSGEYF